MDGACTVQCCLPQPNIPLEWEVGSQVQPIAPNMTWWDIGEPQPGSNPQRPALPHIRTSSFQLSSSRATVGSLCKLSTLTTLQEGWFWLACYLVVNRLTGWSTRSGSGSTWSVWGYNNVSWPETSSDPGNIIDDVTDASMWWCPVHQQCIFTLKSAVMVNLCTLLQYKIRWQMHKNGETVPSRVIVSHFP